MQQHFNTVLGGISENEVGIVLPHEHFFAYSEYLCGMVGKDYIDKEEIYDVSVGFLKKLKSKYGLNTLIDCTPVNIGRDVEFLKDVSRDTGVNIICSTGFYYTEEPLLQYLDIGYIVDYMISDANKVNAGIIKCAVEKEVISALDEKMLTASAKAQLKLKLPMVVHTNANNKNGIKALEILLQEGVNPQAITISHLSDTDDLEYIKRIANKGCFIGFDRLYGDESEEYIDKIINKIMKLCDLGYQDKILLSHDALFFNGFEAMPKINKKPRFSYVFDYILPRLPKDIAEKIIKENPLKMLSIGE